MTFTSINIPQFGPEYDHHKLRRLGEELERFARNVSVGGPMTIDWGDITNKPTFETHWDDITGKPACFEPCYHVHTFISLNDTPAAYAGAGGRYVRVNGSENALEFSDVDSARTFLALTDTPNIYTGSENLFVTVNEFGTGLVFSDIDVDLGLTDNLRQLSALNCCGITVRDCSATGGEGEPIYPPVYEGPQVSSVQDTTAKQSSYYSPETDKVWIGDVGTLKFVDPDTLARETIFTGVGNFGIESYARAGDTLWVGGGGGRYGAKLNVATGAIQASFNGTTAANGFGRWPTFVGGRLFTHSYNNISKVTTFRERSTTTGVALITANYEFPGYVYSTWGTNGGLMWCMGTDGAVAGNWKFWLINPAVGQESGGIIQTIDLGTAGGDMFASGTLYIPELNLGWALRRPGDGEITTLYRYDFTAGQVTIIRNAALDEAMHNGSATYMHYSASLRALVFITPYSVDAVTGGRAILCNPDTGVPFFISGLKTAINSNMAIGVDSPHQVAEKSGLLFIEPSNAHVTRLDFVDYIPDVPLLPAGVEWRCAEIIGQNGIRVINGDAQGGNPIVEMDVDCCGIIVRDCSALGEGSTDPDIVHEQIVFGNGENVDIDTTWTVPADMTGKKVRVLVVAAGGSSSSIVSSGGGGGGGVIYENDYPVTPSEVIPVYVPTSTPGADSGDNAVFGSLTAIGGGVGSQGVGGSGGGGSGQAESVEAGGVGTAGQGSNGGDGKYVSSGTRGGGGGGGAGSLGGSAEFRDDAWWTGDGGAGRYFGDIFGLAVGDGGWFASGGVGGGSAGTLAGSPLPGGGGTAEITDAVDINNNTGGGGGGPGNVPGGAGTGGGALNNQRGRSGQVIVQVYTAGAVNPPVSQPAWTCTEILSGDAFLTVTNGDAQGGDPTITLNDLPISKITGLQDALDNAGGGGILPMTTGEVPPVFVYGPDGSLIYFEV